MSFKGLFRFKEVLVLLAVVAFTHFAWFTFGTFTFGDTWYETSATIKEYVHNFERSGWNVTRDLGSANVEPYFFVLYFLRGLMGQLGLFYEFSMFALYYAPIIFLAPLGMYFLGRRIGFKEEMAALGGGVYALNTYFLTLQSEHLALSLAYAVVPLSLYMVIKALDNAPSLSWSIGASLVLAYQSILEPRIFLLVTPLYIALFFWHRRPFKHKLAASVPVAVLMILMNLYWLPTFLLGSQESVAGIVDRGLFGDSFKSVATAITMMHPSWTGSQPIPFTLQPVKWYFWLLPIFIGLGGLAGFKRKKLSIGLVGLAVVGIFLTKQSSNPLPQSYLWMYEHVPLFNLFRESTKFYLYICLAYALLIPLSIDAIVARASRAKPALRFVVKGLLVFSVACVLAVSASPLLNGQMGALFKKRNIPEDYQILNSYLGSQKDFYRTAWVPASSRWVANTSNHPAVNVLAQLGSSWSNYSKIDESKNNKIVYYQEFQKFFNEEGGAYAASASGIKYFGVPIRDIGNDDDFFRSYGDDRDRYIKLLDSVPWLKRVSIGTKDLILYENKNYSPYISSLKHVSSVNATEGLDEFIKLNTQRGIAAPWGITSQTSDKNLAFPTEHIEDLYENPQHTTLKDGAALSEFAIGEKLAQLYVRPSSIDYSYSVKSNILNITQRPQPILSLDGQPFSAPQVKNIPPIRLVQSAKYYLAAGTELTGLDLSSENKLMKSDNGVVGLYAAGESIIKNGSFESGLWQPKVDDCNKYDNAPFISMSISEEDTYQGGRALSLRADRHTACTHTEEVAVKPGREYGLSFAYKLKNTQRVSYKLVFNDPNQSVIEREIIKPADHWYTSAVKFQVPSNASSVKLILEGLPDDERKSHSETLYDDVSIFSLQLATQISGTPAVQSWPYGNALPTNTVHTFSSQINNASSANIIPNPSFEEGLWKKKIDDCDAYDDRPKLSMRWSDIASDGSKSLELSATRHLACTNTEPISVQEGSSYVLSFDYKGEPGHHAGYFLSYNGGEGSTQSEQLAIHDQNWQHFNKVISIPAGVNAVSITVYGYADEFGKQQIRTSYDNFNLRFTPDIKDNYYLISSPKVELQNPKKIDFNIQSPTKKFVHIVGAKTPFYLSMAEMFNSKWRLELNNGKVQGINSWSPFAKPNAVAADQHFKLDDFLNGWYVDPAALCKQNPHGCHQNADGSYDVEMIAEFTPQRWFYVGGAVSLATLAGCIGYLGGIWYRRRRMITKHPARPHASR